MINRRSRLEIKALEPRLAMKPDGFQSALDEIARTEPRAKGVKPEEMIYSSFVDAMDKGGFFDQIWTGIR